MPEDLSDPLTCTLFNYKEIKANNPVIVSMSDDNKKKNKFVIF